MHGYYNSLHTVVFIHDNVAVACGVPSTDHEDTISNSESSTSEGTMENDVQQSDVRNKVIHCHDVLSCAKFS